jgi:chromosome segregation ATPase
VARYLDLILSTEENEALMTKITEQDRKVMVDHLRNLNKLAIKANAKHSTNIDKQISHTIELTKFIKEDRAKIERLNNVIDIKQREIDELNSKQMDLLWELAQQEKKISELEKFKEQEEREVAHFEKKILNYTKKQKVDN